MAYPLADTVIEPATLATKVRKNPITVSVWAFAVGLAIYDLYYAFVNPYSNQLYTIFHLGTMIVLYGMTRLRDYEGRFEWTLDSLLILGAGLGTIYFWLIFDELVTSRPYLGWEQLDIVFAVVIVVALSTAIWLEYSGVLIAVIFASFLYTAYGPLFPGVFQHSGADITRMMEMVLLSMSGAFGSLTRIAGLWIYIFIIWAGLLREFGDIESFLDIALMLGKRLKSGVFQVAIVGSMFFGMVTGSPGSNIVVTGNFTIPLMKDHGISADRASAIETVGSLGGMVMPPIMGSAAFIIALLTGRSYGDIIVMAALPAILLYLTLILNVHLAVSRDLRGRDDGTDVFDFDIDREIDLNDTLKKLIPVAVSTVVLVYAFIGLRFGPSLTGIYTIGTYFVVKLAALLYYREFSPYGYTRNALRGLGRGSMMMAPLTIVLAGMMMVVALFQNTSLPLKIALNAEQLAGGSFLLLLLMVAAVTVVFGMGMPVSASYLLGFTLMGPILAEAGVPEMINHFFIFYWAVVAPLTPPVALACAIAANVGEADFSNTVKESLQIGFPYYLLPFAFIAFPDIILHGSANMILVSFVAIYAALVSISFGFQAKFRTPLVNVALIGLGATILYAGTML